MPLPADDEKNRLTRRTILGGGPALLMMAGVEVSEAQQSSSGHASEPLVKAAAPRPIPVSFVAGDEGQWKILSVRDVRGKGLSSAQRLQMVENAEPRITGQEAWILRGVTSNTRYATRAELDELKERQEGLGRSQATRAALIPVKKNDGWWNLAQDQRRKIFEEQSHHNAIGLEYLPQIARRLHHSRDMGQEFDFLTWFEYAPGDSDAFEKLVERLRLTEEWKYVEREVDVRLSRA